jgi:hypothetical protein
VGDGSQNTFSSVLRVSDTSTIGKWAGIGFPDVQSTISSANNYYFIGRGGAYTDRVLSVHIPNAADYGSGAQPKFGVYSTGADLLASVEASTGTSYFKGNVGIGTAGPSSLLNVHGANPFVRINNTSTSDHGIKISYNNSDTHGLHLFYNANIATSYIDKKSNIKRRYDHIYVKSESHKIKKVRYLYDEGLDAGSDHAIVLCDI